MRLNLLLMWQRSLGLWSHDFCPESQNQWDVNLHRTTNPSSHRPLDTCVSPSSPQKADHYTPPISSRSSALFTPVNWLLKLLRFCRSSLSELLSDFLFLSVFHYLLNMWLGHKSETDLWAHLSAHLNASWHSLPPWCSLLPSTARRCHSGRTTCLLKCLSIISATGTRWRAKRKQALSSVHFFCCKITTTCPYFHLHLTPESFTDLTAINNEHWSVHTCSDPFHTLINHKDQYTEGVKKTKIVLGKCFVSSQREPSHILSNARQPHV